MKNQLRRLWLDNKRFFLAACLLFLAGGFIGYLQAPMVGAIVQALMNQVKEIADKINESGGGAAAAFWMIFSNNVVSALMMMALGVFFAIVPIIGVLTNGLLLGFVLSQSVKVSPWVLFGAGILPHGIFELPAILFAAGIGIRLGLLSFRSAGVLFQPNKIERLKNDWYDTLKQFPAAVIAVIALLLVAAIVESTVTPYILKGLIGDQVKLNLLK